jgi:hypothetical protein
MGFGADALPGTAAPIVCWAFTARGKDALNKLAIAVGTRMAPAKKDFMVYFLAKCQITWLFAATSHSKSVTGWRDAMYRVSPREPMGRGLNLVYYFPLIVRGGAFSG